MRLQRYCSCGKRLDVQVPPEKKSAALSVWFARHSGPGHTPATRIAAAQARVRKQEAA